MDKPFILAIDPGNERSAFCLVSSDLHPLAFGKYVNRLSKQEYKEMVERIGVEKQECNISREIFFSAICDAISEHVRATDDIHFVIEGIENFGMPAGRSLFDTSEYIGRVSLLIEQKYDIEPFKIFRHEEKMTICHNPRANDATIKRALVDRFAPGASNYGKGTKKNPGFFYGFRADVWMAFAVAVTYHDKYLCKEETADDLHLDELPF